MNILNVHDIERDLSLLSVRTRYPQVSRWVMTVARNFLFTCDTDAKTVRENFHAYAEPEPGVFNEMPPLAELPEWARQALDDGKPVHIYDRTQNAGRHFWQLLTACVQWLNAIQPDDPVLNRLDRMSFHFVAKRAEGWKEDLSKNPWFHVKDNAKVFHRFEDGYKIVRLETELQFQREAELMNHCINGAHYRKKAEDGTHLYLSLRDDKNVPHVTMEFSLAGGLRKRGTAEESNFVGHAVQIRGNSNLSIKPEYAAHVRNFIKQRGWADNGAL